eukprot:3667767-Prymnesium_polylepis.1
MASPFRRPPSRRLISTQPTPSSLYSLQSSTSSERVKGMLELDTITGGSTVLTSPSPRAPFRTAAESSPSAALLRLPLHSEPWIRLASAATWPPPSRLRTLYVPFGA